MLPNIAASEQTSIKSPSQSTMDMSLSGTMSSIM